MWRTPEGERILKGAEGRLVRASLSSVVDILVEELDVAQCYDDFGVPLFDELETAQKLVMLAEVGKALFDETVPRPMHTAVAEAAVYVLYENIVQEIELEIRCHVNRGRERRKWRHLVLAACRQWGFDHDCGELCDEFNGDGRWGLPDLDCTELDRWSDEVHSLADLVFRNRDWEMADIFMDSEPAVAAAVRRRVGIDDDYYVAVAPLATASSLKRAQKSLADIVRRRPT
jgi:hypothetical protein